MGTVGNSFDIYFIGNDMAWELFFETTTAYTAYAIDTIKTIDA